MEPFAHLPRTPTHRFAVVGLLTLSLASSAWLGSPRPQDLPREISSDAQSYVLEAEKEIAEEELSLVGSLVGGAGTSARWELDGRPVPPGALAGVRAADRVRTVRIDTSDAVLVELLTEATPERRSVEGVEIHVVSSAQAVMDRPTRRTSTLCLLENILVSGDDPSAIGERRRVLERKMEFVEIFSSEAVSRRLGASAPFTFIRASLSVDPRPHLFGAGR